jgi:hypothetical protein
MLELSRSKPGPGEGEPSSASGDILKVRLVGVAGRAARSTRIKCDTADSVVGGTHEGRLQFPASRCLDTADPLLWNRTVNQAAGADEACVIARYPVLGTKSRGLLRSGGQQVATAVQRRPGLQLGSRGRAGACRGAAYGGLCSARVWTASPRSSAQRRRRSGVVAGEVQPAGGQWVSR